VQYSIGGTTISFTVLNVHIMSFSLAFSWYSIRRTVRRYSPCTNSSFGASKYRYVDIVDTPSTVVEYILYRLLWSPSDFTTRIPSRKIINFESM
jgi:hypothetical protein